MFFISRSSVKIIMTNIFKFDMIYAIVTKPEGSFTCDDKTDLKRFMWVMTHDVSVHISFTMLLIKLKQCCIINRYLRLENIALK